MRRIEQLQGIWEMRFSEVEDRYRRGRLTATEAAELLCVCDRTFRRMRERYETEGMAGLSDRRLGKVSPHRIGAAEISRIANLASSASP